MNYEQMSHTHESTDPSIPFLFVLLQAVADRDGDADKIFSFFKDNLEQIDENLLRSISKIMRHLFRNRSYQKKMHVASTMVNCSNALSQFSLGSRPMNLELAIAGYQAVLEFYSRNSSPLEWAMTQNNLGNAYSERLRGNRRVNLERAILAYEAALTVRTRSQFPTAWAQTQANLASAYYVRIHSNRANNIEEAIRRFEDALKEYQRENFPSEWATVQNNLANAYKDRIHGNRADNLEKAISLYEATLDVRTQAKFPIDWASTQNNLGDAYRSRIADIRADNLERAIKCYTNALGVYTHEQFPLPWAMIQHNLAKAYSERIRGNRRDNLELAIKGYRIALTVRKRKTHPIEWATTLNALADAYYFRIEGDRALNLEWAIQRYKVALSIRTRNDFPLDWATMQNGLGNAYYARIKGDRADNIEQAISYSMAALEIRTRTDFPIDWAQTKNNLAICYYARIKDARADNLERAIQGYRDALKVRTRKKLPLDWAATRHNLATAYYARIEGNREANLELAIKRYRAALTVRTYDNSPADWAHTQNNLGNAYLDRIKGERTTNVEDAISCYKKALEVRTQENFPVDWAQTQNNLGNAYSDRIAGDPATNLEEAIAYYGKALEVYTKTNFPIDWASTQYNRANVYVTQSEKHGMDTLEQAKDGYKVALTVLTPEANPYDVLRTAYGLGNLHFMQENWQDAWEEGYQLALQAAEQTRTWATTDKRRQEILESIIVVYDNAIRCHLELQRYDQAILLTERARARHLVDLIHSNQLYQSSTIPDDVQRNLVDHYEALQREINERNCLPKREERSNDPETLIEMERNQVMIAQLQQEKQDVWQQLRQRDKVLAEGLEVSQPTLADLKKLIVDQPHTAIVSFYSTSSDTYVLIMRHDFSQRTTCQYHHCPSQSWADLQAWILENWLIPYHTDSNSYKQKWRMSMPTLLSEIADRLQLNTLVHKHLKDIEELIIIPHVALHLIPFAALPMKLCLKDLIHALLKNYFQHLQGSNLMTYVALHFVPYYLGDQFRLRVLPSAQILSYCHDRENGNSTAPPVLGTQFGSVEDATGDRPIVTTGFEAIAQRLRIPNSNRLLGQEQATTANYRTLVQNPGTKALHSIHHAKSNIDNPLESALLLADGSITLGQILSPGWRMPHLVDVFLSCCETNLGTPTLTDDLLTLATGFLCAGARSVVSTLWSVDALATVVFCDFYYQFREEKSDRPTALQWAQQAMRNTSGAELKQRFQNLYDFLNQQWEEADQKRRNLRKVIKSIDNKHPDYMKYKREFEHWRQSKNNFGHAIKRIDVVFKGDETFPFEQPFYWAGFISSGLR